MISQRNNNVNTPNGPPYDETEAMQDMEYIAGRLDMTKDELATLMGQPNKSWEDYKSDAPMIKRAISLAKALGMERRNYR